MVGIQGHSIYDIAHKKCIYDLHKIENICRKHKKMAHMQGAFLFGTRRKEMSRICLRKMYV